MYMYDRRDSGDREVLGNAAYALCKNAKKKEGITSAKFYWAGDSIIILMEGEGQALNSPGNAVPQEQNAKPGMDMIDHSRLTTDIRLTEPKASEAAYRAGGR